MTPTMNVLYIDHYAGSETLGMEFRPFYLAHEWRRAGIDTTILAADYSHLRSHNPDISEDLEEKVIDGVRFCFLRTRHYHGNNFDRILSMAQFVQKGMKAADELIRRYQPDVVICSSTYPMDTWIGQKIKRKSGAMLIHEIHDLWPLSPRLLGGYSKHHPFIAAMQVAEDSAYRHSDCIVSVLPNVKPYIQSRGFTTPVIHIPNGLPPSYFKEAGTPPEVSDRVANRIQKLKEQGKFVVGYAGGISVSNAMEDLIRAMIHLKDHPEIACVVIGDGILKSELLRLKEEQQLNGVHFEDPIPKAQVIGTLSECDALYLGSQPSPLYEYGVSANKIFDYLLAGRPIINAWDTEHSPMDEVGNTLKARAGDARDIADRILEAKGLKEEERTKIYEESRRFVREMHHYGKLSDDFRRLFRKRKEDKKS